MKSTLIQDLRSPLDEVERKWIRIPVTILFIPIILVVAVIGGSIIGIAGELKSSYDLFIYPCFKGPGNH